MTLLDFYREWLDWAENSGVENRVFSGSYGLCYNLQRWCEYRLLDFNPLEEQLESDLGNLSLMYPFGRAQYFKLQIKGKLHTQKRRLNWVRKRIKALSCD